MKTIHKFELPRTDAFSLSLPRDARFLDIQIQHAEPKMWFLLDPDADDVTRRFVIVTTGSEIPEVERLTYLGTFQVVLYVFHLFEYDAPGANPDCELK